MSNSSKLPVVLVFAGNDPSGGAGLLADTLTLTSLGCHVLPVVTAITVQDTRGVYAFQAVEATYLDQQARQVLNDVEIDAIKVGMIASVENLAVIAGIAQDYPDIPLVVDPVLASGYGDALSTTDMAYALCQQLLPYTWLLTPNSIEARQLILHDFGEMAHPLEWTARRLIEYGARAILVTGTHENTCEVVNTLYLRTQENQTTTWERLPGSYHGSGCTLASAIAGKLALGFELSVAVYEGQLYTWRTLYNAYYVGKGQFIPDRLFWARDRIPV